MDVLDLDALKLLVIQTAREQVVAGAHYLWGAAGNTPGNGDGAYYRPDKVQLHDNVPDLSEPDYHPGRRKGAPFTPMLLAGYADGSEGRLACAGRAGKVNDLPLALTIDKSAAINLKASDLTEEQFHEFKQNLSQATRFRWPRPNGAISQNRAKNSTLWAESCVGKRHFDCIGFVNWCLSKVLKKTVHYGIKHFVGKLSVAQAKTCDILTKGTHHIGIVSEQGTVLHAQDIVEGVVETPIGKNWTNCYRLPASFWKLGDGFEEFFQTWTL